MDVTCCPAWLSAELTIVRMLSLFICLLSTFGAYFSSTSRFKSQGWAWESLVDESERSGRLANTGGGRVGGGGIGGGELVGFTASHSATPPMRRTTAVVTRHATYALQLIVTPVRQEGVEGCRSGVGWEERILLLSEGRSQYLRSDHLRWKRRRKSSGSRREGREVEKRVERR